MKNYRFGATAAEHLDENPVWSKKNITQANRMKNVCWRVAWVNGLG
jgi:hypothetical protein